MGDGRVQNEEASWRLSGDTGTAASVPLWGWALVCVRTGYAGKGSREAFPGPCL